MRRKNSNRQASKSKANQIALFVAIIGAVATILAAIISIIPNLLLSSPEATITLSLNATSSVTNNVFETIPPTVASISASPTPGFTPSFIVSDPSDYIDPYGVPMRLVPAGEFIMGSDADEALVECQKYHDGCQREWFTDEEPPHQVYLDAFYIDKYEVTNASYKNCVESGVCNPPQTQHTGSWWSAEYYGYSQYDNYPVIYVDWYQAKAYCEWRNAELPTEAQWEKAARGKDGRSYPWGEGITCDKANYSEANSYCGSSPNEVGRYESGVSPYGIYDMAGNVWEWVADWYSETYYQNSFSSNPLGPDSTQDKVLRGGAWSVDLGFNLRVSNRNSNSPEYIFDDIGFRCVRSVP